MTRPPKLDHIELSISGGPETTPEQKRIVSALKRLLQSITNRIKR